MNAKLKSRWWVDVILFAVFLAAFFLDLTGLALHQWLGIASGVIAMYHLVKHWDWVKKAAGAIANQTTSRVQTYALIDILLFDGLLAILVTGVVISSWLNLDLAAYATWHFVHVSASLITLALLVLKIGLHWRWIVTVGRALFTHPVRQAEIASSGSPAHRQRPIGRREFGRLMAVVGIGSLFALGNGVKSLSASNQDSATVSAAANSVSTGSLFTSSQNVSAGTVSARCPRGCSCPGHCRRYVDSNSNGRCDLGETG